MRAANQKLRVGVVLTFIGAHCVTILPRRAEEQSGSNSAAAQALFDSAGDLGDGTSDNIRMTPIDVPWMCA